MLNTANTTEKPPIRKIYISGGLTNLKKGDLKDVYARIGEICSRVCEIVYIPHLQGTDPVRDPHVTPEVVWQKDHREVSSADLIIAYVGEPSLGVGAELEIARMATSVIILWWFAGEKVSRMALGNPAVRHTIEARDKTDLYEKLEKVLEGYDSLGTEAKE